MANTKQTQNSNSTSGFVKFPSPTNSAPKKILKTPMTDNKQVKTSTKPVPQIKPTPASPLPTNNFGDFGFPPTNGNRNGDKTEQIKKVFKEVLGKEPEPRDLSYYRFSPMSEEEIKEQLLTGKEHQELLKKGNEYNELNEQLKTQKAKVMVLNGQIKDQLEEFKQLHNLLKEKNRYIREIRGIVPEVIDNDGNVNNTYNEALDQKPQVVHTNNESLPPSPPIPHFTNSTNNYGSKKKGLFKNIFRS